MSLEDDFASFRNSPEAKKPAFEVREDWREWQYQQALINGDIHADENPDISLENNWAEPDFAEPDIDELEGLELVTKLSRKTKKLGFGDSEDEL